MEFGKGEIEDSLAGELKEEIEITASSTPVLQTWTYSSKTDFHADEYKSKITKIKFASIDKVPGNRVEAWDVSNAKDKSVMAWIEDDSNDGYILTIAGKEKVVANSDSSSMFLRFSKVTQIEEFNILDTRNVTTMNSMFFLCSSLTNLNLSNFNTSKVTNMGQMFQGCTNLTDLDISSFDTSKVTTFLEFLEDCTSLKNLNLGSNFNFTNAKDIQCMFHNCNNLTTTINFNRKSNLATLLSNFLVKAATIPPAKITINYLAGNEFVIDGFVSNKGNSNIVKGSLIE